MVHGCMVYTEFAPRRQQFHVAPAMSALKHTASVDNNNNNNNKKKKTRYKKKLVTYVESHASAVSLLKRARIALYKRPSIKQSLTVNETLTWVSSLPILMQESFWW